jgi:dTDP-L-rhamnose 4-epimerase
MTYKVLVAGGAGFVGSHLVRALLRAGHGVRVLDSFVQQVHGETTYQPPAGVELVRGDVRDPAAVKAALDGVEAVYHLAAEVGVGQSMYEIRRYVEANDVGTSVLLEALVERRHQVRKLVVASSMSIYGEGAYQCEKCGPTYPLLRPAAQFRLREWEVRCPKCRVAMTPIPTPEAKRLIPASVYAITKQNQEQLCLVVGRAYDIPTVALRYFNIYGPGQALSNPYTGALAIFSGRLLNRAPPLIFEDGLQTRDFIHVSDIVRANLLALESDAANFQAINVGTGRATTVLQVAELLAQGLKVDVRPLIVGRFREGDIRHCVADVSSARTLLGFTAQVPIEEGIPDLLGWVRGQQATDRIPQAADELQVRGLIR